MKNKIVIYAGTTLAFTLTVLLPTYVAHSNYEPVHVKPEPETVHESESIYIEPEKEIVVAEPIHETETAMETETVEWYQADFVPIQEQTATDFDSGEAVMLQKLAYAESGNQGIEGMALIMNVVLNRVESDMFPDTIAGVILQDEQFSVVSNGMYESAEMNDETRKALAMVESGFDESFGAMWFESVSSTSTWHKEHLTFMFQYNDVLFYTYLGGGNDGMD